MDKNWHRKLFINLLLKAVPYKIMRAPGVKYSPEDSSFDKYLKNGIAAYLDNAAESRIRGVVGCWIAHTRIMESVKERTGITVVLEDDFICKDNFFQDTLKLVNAFDKDFDIIIVDPWGMGPLGMHKVSDGVYASHGYSYPYYAGAHCLFVNNARIPAILETIFSSPVYDYDGLLLNTSKLNVFMFYTGKCSVRTVGSDIAPGFKPKYDVKAILACLLPAKMRDRSERLTRYFHKREEKNVRLSNEQLAVFEGEYEAADQSNLNIKIERREDKLLLTRLSDHSEILFQAVTTVDFIATEQVASLKFTQQGTDVTVLVNESGYKKKQHL